MIGLILVVNYLLNRQMKALEIAFLKEGGLRERMTKARIEERNKRRKQNNKDWERPAGRGFVSCEPLKSFEENKNTYPFLGWCLPDR